MSGRAIEVRIVPHKAGWAVKLVGGLGNKPVTITSQIEEARKTANGLAYAYEVPIKEYDCDGALTSETPWRQVPKQKWRKRV